MVIDGVFPRTTQFGQSSEGCPNITKVLERERYEGRELAGSEVGIAVRAVLCLQVESKALIVIAEADVNPVQFVLDEIEAAADGTGPVLDGVGGERGGDLLAAVEIFVPGKVDVVDRTVELM